MLSVLWHLKKKKKRSQLRMCYRNLFKVDKDLYYVIMRSIKRSVNNRWTVFGKIKRLWSVQEWAMAVWSQGWPEACADWKTMQDNLVARKLVLESGCLIKFQLPGAAGDLKLPILQKSIKFVYWVIIDFGTHHQVFTKKWLTQFVPVQWRGVTPRYDVIGITKPIFWYTLHG